MFTGRNTELQKLNEMYASNRFECAIIYGRRRVGKTTLIKEFAKGKRAVYFLAREADGGVNLGGFSNDVYAVAAPELKGNAFFSDWEKAFDYIYQISKDRRMVLAIDEYPYLANGCRSISSILQAHIDNDFKDSRLFLILCGSSMSFMEKQVLAYKSPLYGRRTAQFKILPFSFFAALPFLKGFAKEETALLYGITDGIPEYLIKINPQKSLRENIIDLFLTPSGHLYEEPENLLKQELREPSAYNGMIEAIADGASRLNEIAAKCGMESNKCAKYMKSLISLGIVKKELPVTETVSKKSIYLLEDMMFRFWYRFVFPNMSGIVSGLGTAIFDGDIAEQLPAYMGLVFEEICKQYIFEEAKRGATPFLVGNVGRWWGNNPNARRQEEIDILTFRKDNALFCECKWTAAPVDSDVLETLKARSDLFAYKNKWFWMFAKTGFTDRLRTEADQDKRIRLVAFEEMA
jgi:AAA+ ATPase superfamily predicted ATPase